MDDLTLRLAVLVVVGIAVAVFALVRRRLRERPRRTISATGLAPGAYLFTSGDCAECANARSMITKRLGSDGFTEVAWESEPGIFERLGVTAVPSSLLVAPDGSGVWHAGVPRNP